MDTTLTLREIFSDSSKEAEISSEICHVLVRLLITAFPGLTRMHAGYRRDSGRHAPKVEQKEEVRLPHISKGN